MSPVVWCVLLIVWGVLAFTRPQAIWEITERWTSNEGVTPSKLYLNISRVSGVISVLVGLCFMVWHLRNPEVEVLGALVATLV